MDLGDWRGRLRPLLVVLVVLALAGSIWQVRDVLGPTGGGTGTSGARPSEGAPEETGAESDPNAVETLPDGRKQDLAGLAEKAEKLNLMATTPPVVDLVVGSYNVLGASHTGPRGSRRHMADGNSRVARAIALLHANKVDVAGLQEFQHGQRETFASRAGDVYDMYPALAASRRFGQNSIVWRKDRFELVEGGAVGYPYFSGRLRPYPQILLREKRTGVQFYVTSYHNPANNAGHGNQDRNRARALALQIANANALLEQTERPMIITGDMNARRAYVCPMVTHTAMRPAQGGGCDAPSQGIDWLMGSVPQVAFRDYVQDRTPQRAGLSDHPLILATARVTGLPDDRREAEDPWSEAPESD